MGNCRVISHITVTSILYLAAVALLVAAIVTPDWLEVLEPSSKQHHRHGLWQDCTQSVEIQNADSYKFSAIGEDKCIYKEWPEKGKSLSGDDLLHHWNVWQAVVLGLTSGAALFAIISMILSCLASVSGGWAIAWSVVAFITAGAAAGAVGVFAFNASSFDVKHLVIDTGKPRVQRYSYSFWLLVAGFIVVGVLAFLSLLNAVFLCIRSRSTSSSKPAHKTWPKPGMNNTVV